jgi:PIN domain nuclease of toxin-antitoxin system
MIAGVADTHVALWYLFGDSRLSKSAKAFIDQAANARRKVALSVISLAETIYVIEKNRLAPMSSKPCGRFHEMLYRICPIASSRRRRLI